MASLDRLAPELLGRIATFLKKKNIAQLRLVSTRLAVVLKGALFRNISMRVGAHTNGKSSELFLNPDLNRHIRHLKVLSEYADTDRSEHDVEHELDLNGEAEAALVDFRKLPALKKATLWFQDVCHGPDNDYEDGLDSTDRRDQILGLFFDSLGNPEPPARMVSDVTIRYLQNINSDYTSTPAFERVISQLKSLRLFITNDGQEAAPENAVNEPELHSFFLELPSYWLQPASNTLTRLVLYSKFYFGYFPRLDLSHVFFPKLKVLGLGNYSFAWDWQFDWIIKHKDTLSHLYLDDCCIMYQLCIYSTPDEDGSLKLKDDLTPTGDYSSRDGDYVWSYARRWHEVFDRFADELSLQEFRIGHGPWWDEKRDCTNNIERMPMMLTDERYMVYDEGIGPCQYTQEPSSLDSREGVQVEEWPKCDEEDLAALLKLTEKTGQVVEMNEEGILSNARYRDQNSDDEEDVFVPGNAGDAGHESGVDAASVDEE